MIGKGPRHPERSFGLSVGLVLVGIAALLWWKAHPLRAELLGGLGGVLIVCGLAAPRVLYYPNVIWMRFAHVLGYVNARILLTILFAVVLVPVSTLWRLTGKDPLARRRRQFPGWSPYPSRYRSRKHYETMF